MVVESLSIGRMPHHVSKGTEDVFSVGGCGSISADSLCKGKEPKEVGVVLVEYSKGNEYFKRARELREGNKGWGRVKEGKEG